MSVLWPDSDACRARQSLRNALYQIRHSLGSDVLTNRGSVDVGVNLALLSVDAVSLRAAVTQGRYQEAASLYGGPLLSGFHLDDSPAFDEWTELARSAIRGDALRAFREAARVHESAGDLEAARSLLRRAHEIAPTDEEILRHRLLILAGQGNRAAAVAEGEAWIVTLRSSLQIDPSEQTLRLMHDLRHPRTADAAPPSTAPPPPVAPVSSTVPAGETTATASARRHARPRSGAQLGWVLAAATLTVLAWMALGWPPGPPAARGVIVEPFAADSAAGGRTAGIAVGALTARYLEPGTGGLMLPAQGIPAASFDGRHRRLITGRIRQVKQGLVADARVATTEEPGRTLARATAAVEGHDLEALAIAIADELVGQGGLDLPERGPIPRFTRAPGAIVPFFEGEVLGRAGRTQEARDAYLRALNLDSTFAMAYYRLSVTQALLGSPVDASRASDEALDRSVDMTQGERKLLDAWRAYQGGGVEQALPRYEALAASRGPDPDVWLRLAEIRFHWGPQLGIPRDSAENALRVLLRIVPDDANALQHLIRLIGPTASPQHLDEVVRRLGPLHAPEGVRMEAAAIVSLNRRVPPDRSVARWLGGKSFSVESRQLQQLAASARVPYDLASLVRALPPTDDPYRSILRKLLLAQLAASSGRMREASAVLDTLSDSSPNRALEYRCFLALSSSVPPPADTLWALRRLLRSVPHGPGAPIRLWSATRPGSDSPRAIVLDAMLTSRLGEPVDSSGLMARGRAESHEFDPDFVDYLRADILASHGMHSRVLAILGPGSPESSRLYPDPFSYLVGSSKWMRIQALLSLGRQEEALRWLETIPDVGGYDLVYVAPALLLRGRILERLGRDAQAASSYRRAAEIWARADPEFDSLVASARRGAERTEDAPES